VAISHVVVREVKREKKGRRGDPREEETGGGSRQSLERHLRGKSLSDLDYRNLTI